MTVAAISWDVSTISDSGVGAVDSQTGLFGALSDLDALPIIKAPRKDRTTRDTRGLTLSSGLQRALKAFLVGTMDDLWLPSRGDMGRERCEGQPGTGPFVAMLAYDSLLTIRDRSDVTYDCIPAKCNAFGYHDWEGFA
ncbi:hypothetical protein MTO96_013688 [Rhipicephalus appendiculatus]